jgi:hypothetical protein
MDIQGHYNTDLSIIHVERRLGTVGSLCAELTDISNFRYRNNF